MNTLLQVIPQWEINKEITSVPREHLLEMMRKILSTIGRSSNETSQEKKEKPAPTEEQEKSQMMKLDVATETEEESSKPGEGSFVSVLDEHSETIRLLEERLASRDREFQTKTEELMEAKDDLVRDEHIFTEKMKEMQVLKKVARDLRKEKDELLQKAEADANLITKLNADLSAKETEMKAFARAPAENQTQPVEEEAESKPGIEAENNRPGAADETLKSAAGEPEARKDDPAAIQKQEAVEVLNKIEAVSLHKEIETQIVELQAEIRKKEDEAKGVKKELEALDRASAIGKNGKKQLHEELEQNLKKLTSNLKLLKKQRWQLESQHLEQQKAKADEKVQHLQHQVSKMRAQQDTLKKKIKDTTDKFEDRHEQKRRLDQTKGDDLPAQELTKPENQNQQQQQQDQAELRANFVEAEERNRIYKQGGETLLTSLEEIFGKLKQHEVAQQDGNGDSREKEGEEYKNINESLKVKLQRVISSWYAEKQAVEQTLKNERVAWEARFNQHEQLERDHKALREELENTKSLMHKAGLGIRLSSRSVREISDGDVDLRTSISLPPSRGS